MTTRRCWKVPSFVLPWLLLLVAWSSYGLVVEVEEGRETDQPPQHYQREEGGGASSSSQQQNAMKHRLRWFGSSQRNTVNSHPPTPSSPINTNHPTRKNNHQGNGINTDSPTHDKNSERDNSGGGFNTDRPTHDNHQYDTLAPSPLSDIFNTDSPAALMEYVVDNRNDKNNNKPYQPNILMVVIDDLGYADLGFKGSGISTPTIDQLTKDGTLLTNFYVLSACTLTRAAIMSGKYPYRSGLYGVISSIDQFGMNPNDETIPMALRRGGYQAHAVGKWHLGHVWHEYLPTFRGFQSFYGFWGGQEDYFEHTDKTGAFDFHWDDREFCGLNCTQYPESARNEYSTELFTNQTINRIRQHNPKNGPLFLYLAHQAVHSPYQAPESMRKSYLNRSDWSDTRITYAGMLTDIDHGLSRIIQTLKDKGMWDDTLIVLSTDNGAPVGENQGGSNSPLRGAKHDIYEGSVRADGIIAGPARVKLGIEGGINPNLFHVVDWLPTITGLVGVSPETPVSELDGIDQTSGLRTKESVRDGVYLGYEYDTAAVTAYRLGDMKYIRRLEGGTFELYNLTIDIREEHDLSARQEYASLESAIRSRISRFESEFNKTIVDLGSCPRKAIWGETPWGEKSLISWCDL